MGLLPFEKEKREIIVLREEEPGKWGYFPNERPINEYLKYGIINLDKPRGPTSHQVSDWVKKILNAKKAGHGGTLDPKVTGVLPVAINKATRILNTLLFAGKEYVALMHLHKNVEEEKIREVMNSFVGTIIQKPPVRSHVKRKPRKRKVYYLEILEIEGKDVLFRVGVEAGTYIRKLCHDIGEKLGVGAHMVDLRRTKAGGFSEKDERFVILQDLVDAMIFWKEGNKKYLRWVVQPVENAVKHLPKIWVVDSAVSAICHGAGVAIPGIAKLETGIKRGNRVAILTLKGELIGIGIANLNTDEILERNKGIAVKTDTVIMDRNLYPKMWH